MAKKDVTAPKMDWAKDWCDNHKSELENYRGMTVTVNPIFGVVAVARNLMEAVDLSSFLRKRIVRTGLCYVDVDKTLQLQGEVSMSGEEAEEAVPEKQTPPPPLKPVDGKREWSLTAEEAKELLTKPPPPTPPFPSPDRQPPFQPRPPTPEFDRDVVIDGSRPHIPLRSMQID